MSPTLRMTRLAAPNDPSGAVTEVEAASIRRPIRPTASSSQLWQHPRGVSGFPRSMNAHGIVARSGAVSNGRTDGIRDVG